MVQAGLAKEAKARPIIFSDPMVRAILEGRKTQTRRVIKTFPKWMEDGYFGSGNEVIPELAETMKDLWARSCPYGQPGDRLWVREAFMYCPDNGGEVAKTTIGDYRATADAPPSYYERGRWRSPIFMPRWASRITLELTDVRVERLQDIKTRDIEAEGILPDEHYLGSANRYRHPFIDGWDSLNKARGFGWDANPWVWKLSFKLVNA